MKVRVRIKVGSLENGREGVKKVKSRMSSSEGLLGSSKIVKSGNSNKI